MKTYLPFLQRVVDMIDLQNMCSGSSLWDLAVITTEAVYFYDDKESMTSGSCKSVPYSTMFSGFADLPDITHWKVVLVVSKTYVDVYTGISNLSYKNLYVVNIVMFYIFKFSIRGKMPLDDYSLS